MSHQAHDSDRCLEAPVINMSALESPVLDDPDVNALLEPLKNLTLSNKRASLLGLPAELRNTIYRLVLVSPDPIVTDHNNHTLPFLTTTSRQLHNETMNIYLTENRFHRRIRDLKPDMPANFSQHWIAKIPGQQYTLMFEGSITDWQNLKEWLRKFHQRTPGFGFGKVPDEFTNLRIVSKAFWIAGASWGSSWRIAEIALEAYKEGTEPAGFAWT